MGKNSTRGSKRLPASGSSSSVEAMPYCSQIIRHMAETDFLIKQINCNATGSAELIARGITLFVDKDAFLRNILYPTLKTNENDVYIRISENNGQPYVIKIASPEIEAMRNIAYDFLMKRISLLECCIQNNIHIFGSQNGEIPNRKEIEYNNICVLITVISEAIGFLSRNVHVQEGLFSKYLDLHEEINNLLLKIIDCFNKKMDYEASCFIENTRIRLNLKMFSTNILDDVNVDKEFDALLKVSEGGVVDLNQFKFDVNIYKHVTEKVMAYVVSILNNTENIFKIKQIEKLHNLLNIVSQLQYDNAQNSEQVLAHNLEQTLNILKMRVYFKKLSLQKDEFILLCQKLSDSRSEKYQEDKEQTKQALNQLVLSSTILRTYILSVFNMISSVTERTFNTRYELNYLVIPELLSYGYGDMTEALQLVTEIGILCVEKGLLIEGLSSLDFSKTISTRLDRFCQNSSILETSKLISYTLSMQLRDQFQAELADRARAEIAEINAINKIKKPDFNGPSLLAQAGLSLEKISMIDEVVKNNPLDWPDDGFEYDFKRMDHIILCGDQKNESELAFHYFFCKKKLLALKKPFPNESVNNARETLLVYLSRLCQKIHEINPEVKLSLESYQDEGAIIYNKAEKYWHETMEGKHKALSWELNDINDTKVSESARDWWEKALKTRFESDNGHCFVIAFKSAILEVYNAGTENANLDKANDKHSEKQKIKLYHLSYLVLRLALQYMDNFPACQADVIFTQSIATLTICNHYLNKLCNAQSVPEQVKCLEAIWLLLPSLKNSYLAYNKFYRTFSEKVSGDPELFSATYNDFRLSEHVFHKQFGAFCTEVGRKLCEIGRYQEAEEALRLAVETIELSQDENSTIPEKATYQVHLNAREKLYRDVVGINHNYKIYLEEYESTFKKILQELRKKQFNPDASSSSNTQNCFQLEKYETYHISTKFGAIYDETKSIIYGGSMMSLSEVISHWKALLEQIKYPDPDETIKDVKKAISTIIEGLEVSAKKLKSLNTPKIKLPDINSLVAEIEGVGSQSKRQTSSKARKSKEKKAQEQKPAVSKKPKSLQDEKHEKQEKQEKQEIVKPSLVASSPTVFETPSGVVAAPSNAIESPSQESPSIKQSDYTKFLAPKPYKSKRDKPKPKRAKGNITQPTVTGSQSSAPPHDETDPITDQLAAMQISDDKKGSEEAFIPVSEQSILESGNTDVIDNTFAKATIIAISINLPFIIRKIMDVLVINGHHCIVVGGYPRDIILHQMPSDIDLITTCDGNELNRLIEPLLKEYGFSGKLSSFKEELYTIIKQKGHMESDPFDNLRIDITCNIENITKKLEKLDLEVNTLIIDEKGRLKDPLNNHDKFYFPCFRPIDKSAERFENNPPLFARLLVQTIKHQRIFFPEDFNYFALNNPILDVSWTNTFKIYTKWLVKLFDKNYAGNMLVFLNSNHLVGHLYPFESEVKRINAFYKDNIRKKLFHDQIVQSNYHVSTIIAMMLFPLVIAETDIEQYVKQSFYQGFDLNETLSGYHQNIQEKVITKLQTLRQYDQGGQSTHELSQGLYFPPPLQFYPINREEMALDPSNNLSGGPRCSLFRGTG